MSITINVINTPTIKVPVLLEASDPVWQEFLVY